MMRPARPTHRGTDRTIRRRHVPTGRVYEGLHAPSARSRIVLIDNYDSFTRNLADGFAQLGADVAIVRNDEVSALAVIRVRPRGVVLSPGPRAPNEAGLCLALLSMAPSTLPILGVCLGHQAIGQAFGGRVVRAIEPVHGRALAVRHRGEGLLAGLPSPFLAARYHSLVVEGATLPDVLEATAWSEDGEIMALCHRTRPIEGVQFHPESYLTPVGPAILAAFLRRCGFRPRSAKDVLR